MVETSFMASELCDFVQENDYKNKNKDLQIANQSLRIVSSELSPNFAQLNFPNMKLSIQKSLVVLLMLIANCTVSGQVYFQINLNLYKPLAESRVAFEDSILTFYAPYKAGKETYFPFVYIHRQDYSHEKITQPFFVVSKRVTPGVSGALTKLSQDDIKKLEAMYSNKENRQSTKGEKWLYAKKGLRMYDCNFEDNPSNETFHLFLGSKSDSRTNHFANIKDIKKKISRILIDNPGANINIHFSDRNKLCNGDDTYVNHSIKYLTYGEHRVMSSLKKKEALEIINQNWNTIIQQISEDSEKDVLIEKECIEFYSDFNSENRIYFGALLPTRHKHPITGKYTNDRGDYYLGNYHLLIELNRKGDFLSVRKINEEFPNFYNQRYYYGESEDEISISQGPTEPVINAPAHEPNENEIAAFVQSEPEYPGGREKLYDDIYSNITYPEMEKENNIQGTVYISFIVEKAGNITDIRIDRGVNGGPNLSKEALKAVKKLKPFTPAKLDGKPVRYRYRIPIKFTPRD